MNFEDEFDLGQDFAPVSVFAGMDRVSAARLLTELDGMGDEALEEVFRGLEEENIPIDLSDLPQSGATGEAARRLREEEQLVRGGKLLTGLEENDPLRLYLEELAAIPAAGDSEVLALELLEGRDVANRLVNLSLSRVVELATQAKPAGQWGRARAAMLMPGAGVRAKVTPRLPQADGSGRRTRRCFLPNDSSRCIWRQWAATPHSSLICPPTSTDLFRKPPLNVWLNSDAC